MHNVSKDNGSFDTFVHGDPINFSVNNLALLHSFTDHQSSDYSFIDWTEHPHISNMAKSMHDNPAIWFVGLPFKHSDLFVPFRILNIIVDSCISPSNHSFEITKEKILFLYALTHNLSIDLPFVLFAHICDAHSQRSTHFGLPYGVCLTNFLHQVYHIEPRPNEAIVSQDTDINCLTISYSITQKKPITSVSSSTPPLLCPSSIDPVDLFGGSPSSSTPSPPSFPALLTSSSSVPSSDSSIVVVYALTTFNERLSHLEKTIADTAVAQDWKSSELEEKFR